MLRLLWLDDSRNPFKDDCLIFSPIGKNVEVFWVKSYNDFVFWILENGLPDGICFDHDLGDINKDKYEKTGYDAAKWLVNYCLDNDLILPKWNVQSSNPAGKYNINSLLQNFLKR